MSLSTGVLAHLHSPDGGPEDPIGIEPTVQVLSVKKVINSKGPDRYRLIISDGEHFMQAMLAVGLNDLIGLDPPSIGKNTIIRLMTYACNMVSTRRVVIILTVNIVSQEDADTGKVGNPVSIDLAAAAAVAAPEEPVAPAPAPVVRRAPAAKAMGGGGGANNNKGPGGPIYPIEGLSPYQNKWTIKARVTQKSDIRYWTNAKGEGKLFSVNLLDESGEIKATGFNEAVDNLYPVFEEGKVYYISKARVNVAKKQFSNLTSEYEITFENSSEVTLCEDQDSAPQIQYNFVPLADLNDIDKDTTVDVLGIVREHGELGEITAKATNKLIKKRELTIVDQSGYSCRVTLWNKQAENWQGTEDGIYAFKGAKVGDFGGKTLSMGGQSSLSADPDIREAHALRGWYDNEGKDSNFTSFSSGGGGGGAMSTSFKKDEFKDFGQIESEQLGLEKLDQFSIRATVVFVKPTAVSYPACPTPKCAKKMTMEAEDTWRCEKCDASFPAPDYRYILSLSASDAAGGGWLSAFNEAGSAIVGMDANELEALKNEDQAAHDAALKKVVGKMFNFGIRAKSETYNDVTRVKYQVSKAAEVDWKEGTRDLMAMIDQYE